MKTSLIDSSQEIEKAMTLEELTEILISCSRLAENREQSRLTEENLQSGIDHERRARLALSRDISSRLRSIEPILRRLPENEVLLIGEWVYWEGDDGPCQAKIRRVYDLAGLLAETEADRCEFDGCLERRVEGHPSGLCQGHIDEHVALIATLGDDALVDAIERADRAYPDADQDLKAAAQQWCPDCHRPIMMPTSYGAIHANSCHCGMCWKAGCNEQVKSGYSYCAAHAFVVPNGGKS